MDFSTKSYLSAGEFPIKLLQLAHKAVNGKILPYHISLNITNKCNAKCWWCSCADIDRQVEMSYNEIINILHHFHTLGARALTITGGGEPTLHPDIFRIITYAHSWGYDVALITNGIKWGKTARPFYLDISRYLTWMRISVTPTDGEDYLHIIRNHAEKFKSTDLSVSIVIPDEETIWLAKGICVLVHELNQYTHIRCVDNILKPNPVLMKMAEEILLPVTNKVIIQSRDKFTKGISDCKMSRLRPIIAADGTVYPCCGTQYMTEDKQDRPSRFEYCHWSKFENKEPFDGSICDKCYYSQYNKCLNALTTRVRHPGFL